jgi:hypothetical protein
MHGIEFALNPKPYRWILSAGSHCNCGNRKFTNIFGLKAFLRLVKIIFHFSILIKYLETLIGHDRRKMNKNVFPALRVQDKTVPFFAIKPFDFTFSHDDTWMLSLKT